MSSRSLPLTSPLSGWKSCLHVLVQVGLQVNVPQPTEEEEDDVESALNELQISLDGGCQPSDHTGNNGRQL